MLMVPTPMPMEPTTPSARGPLMPSPPLMLMLMPMPTTDTTVMDTVLDTEAMATPPTEAMPMVPTPMPMELTTPSARGPLMPSPLLMLMLTTDTTAMLPPTPTDMPAELMLMLPTPMDTDPTCGKQSKPKISIQAAPSSKIDLKFPFK